MPTKTYLTCAETAKLVRVALKEAFPGVKFSVRSDSYAGGASMRVRWTDGPFERDVEKVAKAFEGGSFDGMIDLKSYHTSVLDGGEVVHHGADYVFTHRAISPELFAKVQVEAELAFSKNSGAVEGYGPFTLDSPYYDSLWTPVGTFQGGNGWALVRFMAERMTPARFGMGGGS